MSAIRHRPVRSPEEREQRRQWKRAHEARSVARGQRMVTVRLSSASARALAAICAQFACCPRDGVERLLLGAAYEPSKPIPPHGLSEAEMELARSLGVHL